MQRMCSISVDIDPLSCYHRIHGLAPPNPSTQHGIFSQCVPRFAEILERRGIQATYFVLGEDLDIAKFGTHAENARKMLGQIAAGGNEIGNHSYSHPYDLSCVSRGRVAQEIGRAHTLLQELLSKPVRGFRGPGYGISTEMLEELMRMGYLYDSSVLPSPSYYVAKFAAMAGMKLFGRTSGSTLTGPGLLFAPTVPYRPSVSTPWRRGQASLVELPIGVTRFARIPLVGTFLLGASPHRSGRWLESVRKRQFLHLSFHGIDLADPDGYEISSAIRGKQLGLGVPLRARLRAFEAILDRLAGDYEFVTLDQAAVWVQREKA